MKKIKVKIIEHLFDSIVNIVSIKNSVNSVALMAMPLGKCLFHQYKLHLWIGITVYTPVNIYPLTGPACLCFNP